MSAWWVRGPILAVLATLLLLAVLDFWFELTGQPPVGEYVSRWTQRYPIFAGLVATLVGALLAHFFWQP